MAIRFNCPQCKREILFKYLKAGDEFCCPHCDLRAAVPESGELVKDFSESDVTRRTNNTSPTRKSGGATTGVETSHFAAVKVLSTIIKVAAWIISIASIIIGIVALSNHAPLAGIGCFLGGGLILIVNLAIAELLLVLLAIEENTRKAIAAGS